jgi:TRAP-type mannitol/chloroaromatic compound transport system permease large subunit
VSPFIIIQLLAMGMIAYWPQLATWLPTKII